LGEKEPTSKVVVMDEFLVTLYMVLGILLRIGIPLGATFLLAHFLRRLDAKWREEARQVQPGESILLDVWLNNPCWEELGCVEEQREICTAYQQTEKSCWEVFRENGRLKIKCQECEYRKALLIPIKVPVESTRRQI
jgi:hypothetical protein